MAERGPGGGAASKLQTDCAREHAASLQCISENVGNRDACQAFFDDYKQCRQAEQQRRLEANARKGSWFG